MTCRLVYEGKGEESLVLLITVPSPLLPSTQQHCLRKENVCVCERPHVIESRGTIPAVQGRAPD